ncbi:hypothetical protein [Bradyrhizobium sp.]|uniref:hypothetical protein n=1 Tax=Bradyrhizobium sp. TaxID=376 RepID=UPI00403833E1
MTISDADHYEISSAPRDSSNAYSDNKFATGGFPPDENAASAGSRDSDLWMSYGTKWGNPGHWPVELSLTSDQGGSGNLPDSAGLPGNRAFEPGVGTALGRDSDGPQHIQRAQGASARVIEIDSQISRLIDAMAAHSVDRFGFDTTGWTCVMPPPDTTRQGALAVDCRS